MPGHSTPFTIGASGNYGPVPTAGGFVVLTGISVGETGGAAASIELREGTVTGKVIGRLNLPANGSTPFGELPNVRCQGQLYCLITGALSGAVYIR